MGQAKDEADTVGMLDETPPEADGGLRQAAVAIDPPPRGALGIRELLDLLEKEVGREFPAVDGTQPKGKKRTTGRARRRA